MTSTVRVRRRLIIAAALVVAVLAAVTAGAAGRYVVSEPILELQMESVTQTTQSINAPANNVFKFIQSIVQIRTGFSGGSGILLGSVKGTDNGYQTYILTANHVLHDKKEVEIIDFHYLDKLLIGSRVHLMGRVVEVAAKIDAALIVVNTNDDCRRSVELVSYGTLKGVRLGDFVTAIGGPDLESPSATDGRIAVLDKEEIRTSAPIAAGDSGGGIFLQDGRLIGMVTSCRILEGPYGEPMAVPHMSIGTPSPIIVVWLKSVGAGFLVGDGRRSFESFERAHRP
jgi:trypsin-like peptidase